MNDLNDRIDELEQRLERQEDWAGKLVESLQKKMEIVATIGEITKSHIEKLEERVDGLEKRFNDLLALVTGDGCSMWMLETEARIDKLENLQVQSSLRQSGELLDRILEDHPVLARLDKLEELTKQFDCESSDYYHRLAALEQASGLDIERCIAGKHKKTNHD